MNIKELKQDLYSYCVDMYERMCRAEKGTTLEERQDSLYGYEWDTFDEFKGYIGLPMLELTEDKYVNDKFIFADELSNHLLRIYFFKCNEDSEVVDNNAIYEFEFREQSFDGDFNKLVKALK